ncbi:MAG: hypothetical protein NTZ64_01245 [Polaromonas sp.]|nr:hypothetical protein [Polaromonas sp.]
MIPIENLQTLAATSFDSKNFSQAYNYFSQILEQNPSNAEAWIKKGLSSGMISNVENMRLDECLYLIRHAVSLRAEKSLKAFAADKLIDIYEHTIRVLNGALSSAVQNHQKVTMPEGGSTLLYMAGQSIMRINSARSQAQAKLQALDLMVLSVELDPNQATFSALISAIRGLLLHSAKNGNYLATAIPDGSLLTRVNQLKTKTYTEASQKYPEIKKQLEAIAASDNKQHNTSAGCFIATAAMGTYSHPKVEILRLFRDTVLEKPLMGRIAIRFYYFFSPPISRLIGASPTLKAITRTLIVRPAANLAERTLRKRSGNRNPNES